MPIDENRDAPDVRRLKDELAGHEAADPDRLLPGEDPRSPHRDDARRWYDVYAELLAYKERLLSVTRDALEHMRDQPAREEVVETDSRLLEAEKRRLEKRLGFWRERLQELG